MKYILALGRALWVFWACLGILSRVAVFLMTVVVIVVIVSVVAVIRGEPSAPPASPPSLERTVAPSPSPVPTTESTPAPQVVSFPFMWEEGGKLFDGSYLNAVQTTVHDLSYEGPSPLIEGYQRYQVHYSVKYTLYKPWSDFDGYLAIVGPCLEVKTDKGHLYGRNELSIDTYHLSEFLPGEERRGVLYFDISPDENPVELRDYEGVGQEWRIAHIWKLEWGE